MHPQLLLISEGTHLRNVHGMSVFKQMTKLSLILSVCFIGANSATRHNLRLLPLNRGNGGEPPGTINNLIPNANDPYVMDLHPQKRQPGAKVGIPCGLTNGILYDLYGSKRLDLTGDPTKEPPPIESEQSVDGQDCIKADPSERGSDKGSGLVFLLGDPEKVPEPADAPPNAPENPDVVKALSPGEGD